MAEKSAFGQTFGGMMGCLTALAIFGLLAVGGCIVGAGGCAYIASETANDVREAVEEAKAKAEAMQEDTATVENVDATEAVEETNASGDVQ